MLWALENCGFDDIESIDDLIEGEDYAVVGEELLEGEQAHLTRE